MLYNLEQMKIGLYDIIVFSYSMVAGAIDWNICPEVLGMTKGSIARGHRHPDTFSTQ